MKKQLLENLKQCYPFLVRNMASCRQTNPVSLVVTQKDGSNYVYDDFERTFRLLPSDMYNMSETEFAIEFGVRLRKLMSRKGITQEMLSSMTGITQGMISRYVNGLSIPNFYKVDKIAKALSCPADEFRYW